MELIEEIYRIKSLLSENSDPYKIWVASNLESDRGYCVYYLTENNSVIGSNPLCGCGPKSNGLLNSLIA